MAVWALNTKFLPSFPHSCTKEELQNSHFAAGTMRVLAFLILLFLADFPTRLMRLQSTVIWYSKRGQTNKIVSVRTGSRKVWFLFVANVISRWKRAWEMGANDKVWMNQTWKEFLEDGEALSVQSRRPVRTGFWRRTFAWTARACEQRVPGETGTWF